MKLPWVECMRLDGRLWATSAIALLFAVPGLAAQSQDNQKESLGEAARKAREQKKPPAKPVKVLTEDDLARPPQMGPPSVQNATASEPQIPGQTPAVEAARPTPQAAARPETEGRVAKLEGDLKTAKEQLAQAEKGLNLSQREFDLRRDQYYSNPDFKSDKQGKVQLDALQQEIGVRQQEVELLKEKVANLEAERKSLSGAPAPAEKSATPPQP